MNATSGTAKEIFVAAIKLAPDQWDAYLAEACGKDGELRSRVRDLLDANAAAGSFLESPASSSVATVDEPIREGPGTIVGPYKLLEQIGEGGFGLVFMAEQQQPVRRKVAVKILKLGMDTRQVIARFEAERQALALMDHPNIARVLDAGETGSGRPHFVMELVRGVAITDYCDQNRLTTRARLELFVHVCRAVQHAHHKGIIHRDIKPSNVMVTLHDEAPVVKVIDFGIAKALGQQLTDKTLVTGFAQMIGTPMYMSPEQAGMSGLDIDTRSDIYSLGVLLYELLTGTTPFDKERLRAAGYDEMRRIIREEEPARPSTRLSTLGQAAATLSTQRQSDPKRLRLLLRGELDWIVMKALDKDRTRRYETANGFAMDVQRYLHDEPVAACPPSAWYRCRKFARRNRRALTTAAVVTATLGLAGVALIVGTVVFIQRLQHERDVAEKAESAKTTALVEAEAARGAAQTQVIESQTDLGLFAGEQGKPAQAALWFASAAQLARHDPERERANRVRFEAWSRVNYRPVRAFQAGAAVKYLTFDAGERYLVALSKTGRLSAWEVDGEVALPWLAKLPNVSVACLSPNGQTLAVAAKPDRVSLYQFPQGALVGEVDQSGTVAALAFSSDGSLLGFGGPTGARVWDCQAKRFAAPFWPLPSGVTGLVWRPQQAQMLTYGDDNQARLFHVSADTKAPALVCAHYHRLFGTFRGYSVPPVFDPEGRCVLCVSGQAEVLCHDATSGSRLWTTRLTGAPQTLVVSPTGLFWAAGGFEYAQAYAMSDGAPVGAFMPHHNHVTGLQFIDQPPSLLTVGFDRFGRSWSLPDGKLMAGEMIHQDGVDMLATAARRGLQATAQFDGMIRVWQRPRPALTVGPFVRRAGMDSAALSADGRHVLAVSRTSSMCVVRELETASVVGQPFAPPGLVHAAAFHPLRERVAAACVKAAPTGQTGVVQAWDWRTGISVFGPVTTPSLPVALAWAPDGERLVVACASGQILLWDSERGTLVKQLQHPDKYFWYIIPAGLEFSPDGRSFVSFGLGNRAAVWDAAKGHLRFTLSHEGQCASARFSADGRYLLTASVDKTVRVWDAATGAVLAPPMNHPDWVFDAVFRHDGQVVASSGRDGCVRLWDWRKQALVCRVLELPDEAGQLRFTRDDRWLLTMCRDRTVRVWDARAGRPVSPPFPLGQGRGPNFTYCGIQITPDGRRAVVGSLGVLDLTDFLDADRFPPEHEQRLAWSQLLAGQVVDSGGGVVTLTSADWFERWLRLPPADRPALPSTQAPGDLKSEYSKAIEASWGGKRAAVSADRKQWEQALADYPKAIELGKADVRTRLELEHVEKAEVKATHELFDSLVAQARANRLSRRIGQRFDTLKILRKATGTALELKLPPERFRDMRNEALAALALTDLRVAKEWTDDSPGGHLTFAPGLKYYARSDLKGNVYVRRAGDGVELCRLRAAGAGQNWLGFSPDGRLLNVANRGLDRVQVWKLAGKEPPTKVLDEAWRGGVCFSADSREIVLQQPDLAIAVFDLATTKKTAGLPPVGGACHLAFNPKSRQLALGIPAVAAEVRDLETGKVLWKQPLSRDIASLAWSPDGKTLAVCLSGLASGDVISLWNVASGKLVGNLEGLSTGGGHCVFNHAGSLLASTGWEGILRLWDPLTGRQLFSTFAASPSDGGAFSSDDRFLAGSEYDSKLRIWEVAAGDEYRTLTANPVQSKLAFENCAISADGRLLAAGTLGGVGLWDLPSGKNLDFIKGSPGLNHVLLEPSGALLTMGLNGLFRQPIQREPETGLVRLGKPEKLPVPGVRHEFARSADGRVLASAQFDGAVVLLADQPDRLVPLGPHADARAVAVSPNGQWVVTGGFSSGGAKVWKVATGELEKDLPVGLGCRIVFSPDGKRLITCAGNSVPARIRVWEVGTWAEVLLKEPIRGYLPAFSPDGKLLVVESGTAVAVLLNPKTGEEYARLEDPNQHRATHFTFSPDGTNLVSASPDGYCLHVWDLRALRRHLADMGLDWD